MSWRILRFDTDAASADAWSDALLEAGALSVELSDPHAGGAGEVALFDEPDAGDALAGVPWQVAPGAPPGSVVAVPGENLPWGAATGVPGEVAPPPLWPLSRVSALFAAEADAPAALAAAAVALGLPLPPAEQAEVAEQDWVRATQAQFGPIAIGAGLWIVPSWSTPPADAVHVLRLDPGLAFGTGSHPTTRLCLQWLTAELKRGESVLDYGCGSGILAIAAALLGAGRVEGTDIDAQAIRASAANAAANGVQARFASPDALPPGTYDVVVANILANPLVVLAPLLAARTRAGGRIVLSGILARQADEVTGAYTPWFNIAPSRTAEGWVLLSGIRRDASA
jgi:ribosomal protein L11 methyltransferase